MVGTCFTFHCKIFYYYRLEQRVQLQVRLHACTPILKEQSDQGLYFCHSICVIWVHLTLQCKPNFLIYGTDYSGARFTKHLKLKIF